MDQPRPLIAVLDDEPQYCRALARLLKTHGFEVATYARGEDLLGACGSRLPDCLLLDLHMPGLSGFDVLERVAAKRVPVLVITGYDQPGNAERVLALGCAGYFLKPVNESQLLTAVHAAVDHKPSTSSSPGSRHDQSG